jgi:hypothetical protein
MVNGRLVCLGSAPHLSSKYGSGYRLEITTRDDREDAVASIVQNVKRLCPEAEPAGTHSFCPVMIVRSCCCSWYCACAGEAFGGQLRMLLGPSPPLALLFRALCDLVASGRVADYVLCQPSLEQVFVHFIRQQRDEATQ